MHQRHEDDQAGWNHFRGETICGSRPNGRPDPCDADAVFDSLSMEMILTGQTT